MFEKILKDNHLKITPQRLAILKEIQKFGHISIDEIYENIKESNPCAADIRCCLSTNRD